MQNKISINTNMGMLRDRSISKTDNQFAFENHNIRITARDKDTLLSVTNERGNKEIQFSTPGENQESTGLVATDIKGTLLGYAVLNNYLVLFTKENENTDYIYRVEYVSGEPEKWYLNILYKGNLGLDLKHPIETISLFETEDVQKVYWVDGLNQPRVINIKKNYFTYGSDNTPVFSKETIFDFVTDYNHKGSKDISVSIKKQHLGMGSFPAGTIQYLCTYYNKYGQETNPVYISPIYYISPEGRGGDAETTYTCSFKLSFSNVDTEFDFIRVYAVMRTSESGTPIAYIVGTIGMNEASSIVDTGQGDNIVIDPTILLYIGGREISAGTFSHKDNTLFLGDLKFHSSKNDAIIDAAISNCSPKIYDENYISSIVTFQLFGDTKYGIPYYKNDGLYPYKSQLDWSSDAITTFKGGEKYRFAVQFITPTGERSRAFFIGDKVNPLYPEIDTVNCIIKRPLPYVTLPSDVTSAAVSAGYRQVVLLMAEASDGDRSVVAQGIISPTVFNLSQRKANAPFAISSWYMRPRNSMIHSRHLESVNNVTGVSESNGKILGANVSFCEIQNIQPEVTAYYNEESFPLLLTKIAYYFISTCNENGRGFFNVKPKNYTNILYAVYEFSDGHGTTMWKVRNDANSDNATGFNPSSLRATIANPKFMTGSKIKDSFAKAEDRINVIKGWYEAAEIPDSEYPGDDAILHQDEGRTAEWSNIIDVHIQDSSVQSLYSRMNSEQFFVDENVFTLNTPDIEDLQSANVSGLNFRIVGVAEVTSNITDYTIQTTTGLSTAAGIYSVDLSHASPNNTEGLISYPLLYDTSYAYDEAEQKYDVENGSKIGARYYNIFPFHKEGSITHNEHLKEKLSEIEKKTFSNLRYCYSTKYLWSENNSWDNERFALAVTSGSQSTQFKQLSINNSSYIYQGTYDFLSSTDGKEFGIYTYNGGNGLNETTVKGSPSDYIVGSTEPVRVQFQSLPHVVIKFGRVNEMNELLPKLTGESDSVSLTGETLLPWNDVQGIYQKELSYSTNLPYYFIGELYKEFTVGNDDRYGGNNKAALENNRFIPISERGTLSNNSVTLIGTQGDTYFQRWDCLKTEPYSNESKNGIVDITSFMVETHTNIEGRYDVRRGLLKNVTTNRENSNLINKVYSNTNNFFSSSVLNDKYYLADFPNQITWTKTKSLAEDVDTWTNLTLASTLDLDGDKGSVRAIRRFNNALIAFQDRGIAEILFNSRTQIATTAGVPIEIANSGKVDGKRYISEKSGCINKWSIVEAKTGIYFIDNINKNISVIGQGIQDVSTTKGFSSWVRSYNTLDTWNPEDRNNFIAFYDSIHNDVYFVTKHEDVYNDDSCLVYNETLGQFTSFFDYEDVPMMTNIGDKFVSFKTSKLWLQNEGEYNKLFNTKYPYWIKYRICPDPYGDKTFNNIEYRADIIVPHDDSDVVEQVDNLTDRTFDTLKIWNEYQEGTLDLIYQNVKVSDLKKKFRIWRANIPRDAKDPRGLNRIRNPWVYMQLSKTSELDNERMEFHDLLVKYYE